MTDEKWPNKHIKYDSDAAGDAAQARWQKGLDDGLAAVTLQWVADEHTPDNHTWMLAGSCPRCGHDMNHPAQFYGLGFYVDRPQQPTFNIACNCRGAHPTRPTGTWGCGWNKNVSVGFWAPTDGGDGGY